MGSVSLRITTDAEHRRVLTAIPALAIAVYTLKFAYRDGQWEFAEGTVRHKLTERYISSGRKPNEIEPEQTAAIKSLDEHATLRFLFYGKTP
jgi:hypothetical protein